MECAGTVLLTDDANKGSLRATIHPKRAAEHAGKSTICHRQVSITQIDRPSMGSSMEPSEEGAWVRTWAIGASLHPLCAASRRDFGS
jgi:hypothetical protein